MSYLVFGSCLRRDKNGNMGHSLKKISLFLLKLHESGKRIEHLVFGIAKLDDHASSLLLDLKFTS